MQRAQSSKLKGAVSFWLPPWPRGVDQDHLMVAAEVVRLSGPHVAGHQQAGPEHHGFAATADAYPHPPQRGVELEIVHRQTLLPAECCFLEIEPAQH